MSTSSSDSIFSLGTTQIAVPPGATLGLLITPFVFENHTSFKNGAGGTCYVVGVGQNATLSAADLAGAANHYLLGVSEFLSLDGPVKFYFANTGSATHIIYPLFGRSSSP